MPLITDMAQDPDKIRIIRSIVATQSTARPFFLPPGVPSDRAVALRKAFAEAMRNPEFLAEANKLDISPLDGASTQELMAELYAMPKKTVEGAAATMSAPR